MYSAYLDRITDSNQAVFLVEDIQENLLYPATSLPPGSKPGIWFLITIQEETIISIQIDEEKTIEMESSVHNRLARLQSKKKSRFKRH